MAIVKVKAIKSDKQLGAALKYIEEEREHGEEISAEGVLIGNAEEHFKNLESWHKSKGNRLAQHVIQSWNEEDSQKLSPKEFHEMGRQMISEAFPGHDFIIRTHTETGKVHNHILVGAINWETGKKLRGNRKELWKLRDISDRLCKERGLTVLDRLLPKNPDMPEKAQQIVKRGGTSWLFDLVEKANYAATYSTSYGEYVSLLNGFGINAKVEEKNITYFYPGHENKGKRGKKLGKELDKAGLEKRFKENDGLFRSRPEILEQVRGAHERVKNSGGVLERVRGAPLLESADVQNGTAKDYGKYQKVGRRQSRYTHPSEHDLRNSIIPQDEIDRARFGNIPEYCKKNKIGLVPNQNGKFFLKGKEFVEVGDFEWINHKNRTRGNLIDLVAAYKGTTYLKAISIINENPKLLLLEQHFAKRRVAYRSFHIPAKDQHKWGEAMKIAGRYLEGIGVSSKASNGLVTKKQLQVSKSGSIRLFSEESDSGAWEAHEETPGKWKHKKVGEFNSPFKMRRGHGEKAVVYSDPFSAMKHLGEKLNSWRNPKLGILVLMKPDEAQVDRFVGENPRLKKLFFHLGPNGKGPKEVLDFFQTLKKKYAQFGIEIEHDSKERGLKLDGPDLTPGR